MNLMSYMRCPPSPWAVRPITEKISLYEAPTSLRTEMANNEHLIRHMYDHFNARDIDGVLSKLSENVEWANGMEGTHIHGQDAVREYWTYQWSVIDPHVEPKIISEAEDGSVVVSVHQTVHDLEGKLLLDEAIEHVFRIKDGLVTRFDIQGNSQLSTVSH